MNARVVGASASGGVAAPKLRPQASSIRRRVGPPALV